MLIDTENCPSLFVRTAFGEENVDKKRKEKGDCVSFCCCTKYSCLIENLLFFLSFLAIFPQNPSHLTVVLTLCI